MAHEKRWRNPFEEGYLEKSRASPTKPDKDTGSGHQHTQSPQDQHIAKKPKHDTATSTRDKHAHSTSPCADCERLHAAGFAKDRKYLAVQKEVIELKEALNSKDAMILKAKHKLWTTDAASKTTLAAVGTGLQEHKAKLTQKNKMINQLQHDNNELRVTIRALQAKLARGEEKRRGGERQDTHPPGTTLQKETQTQKKTQTQTQTRSPPTYPAPSPSPPTTSTTTPRTASPAPRFYSPGTGRLSPTAYCSNASWDLGFCEVHFNSSDKCKHGRACVYRHRLLTGFEWGRIEGFGAVGRGFLERCRVMTMDKEG